MSRPNFPGLNEYLSEWLKWHAKPSASARKRLRAAVHAVYHRLGLREPQVIFCTGRWDKCLLPLLVDVMLHVGQEACTESAPAEVDREGPVVRDEWKLFWTNALGQIDWKLEAHAELGLGAPLKDKIERKVLMQTETLADMDVEKALGMKPFEALDGMMRRRLGRSAATYESSLDFSEDEQARFLRSLEMRLPPRFREQYDITLSQQTPVTLRGVEGQVHPLHPGLLRGAWLGMWHWQWFPRNDYARKYLRTKLQSTTRERLDEVEALNEAAAYLFYTNACFVMLRPVRASWDEQFRLHCINDAAIEFVDNTKRFMYDGIEVPEQWILEPGKVHVNDVDAQTNSELRRICMDIYGIEHYLRARLARRIHEDEYGILYRLEQRGLEDLVVVRVSNSTPEPDGEFKDYFLRVPPQTRTAREAVAWTFGLTPDEYAPKKET